MCVNEASARRRFAMAAAVVVAALLLAAPGLCGRAFADSVDPAVSYDGTARQLVVQGGQGSATAADLFPAFKGLMPGDQRQQDVQLHVGGASSQVRLYVKAVVDDDVAQSLDPVSLSASLVRGDSSVELQAGSAGRVFSDGVCIATFSGDGDAVLRLRLSVPTSVSNDLADANEQVTWEITAEDDSGAIETTPDGAGAVGPTSTFSQLTQTGDGVAMMVAALLAIATAAVVAFAAAWKRGTLRRQ